MPEHERERDENVFCRLKSLSSYQLSVLQPVMEGTQDGLTNAGRMVAGWPRLGFGSAGLDLEQSTSYKATQALRIRGQVSNSPDQRGYPKYQRPEVGLGWGHHRTR